ncbi:sensor histidine kinase [Chondromyces apiculatus]|uniref:histidine kinase n=1 Tax=Chondromyces apiculatus DSM 436 TaxID=1192034 RepID=A0A017SUX5_9BACT|nr:GAF domain-containing sensor histidine kinase [Chondromyces apiculatus]EYF00789.1 Hypothetical protein CAP_9008 [Chondromyces apiculatus DSM 436]
MTKLLEESRRTAARLRILAEASERFAEAGLDLAALLREVTRKIADDVGDMAVVWMLSGDTTSLDPLAMRHRDPQSHEVLVEMLRAAQTRPEDGLLGRAMATKQTLFLPRTSSGDVLAGLSLDARPHGGRLGIHSLIVVPLKGRSRAVGSLVVARSRGSSAHTEADKELVEDLARHAGFAIENALLFEREKAARRVAEGARERLTLLADASTILGSSPDVEATVESLARLVLPGFADLCMVDLMDPDEERWHVALAHVDPRKERLLRVARGRLDDGHRDGRALAPIEERRPLLNQHLAAEESRKEGDSPAPPRADDEIRQALRQSGVRWSILVPLWARGRPLGMISFGREIDGPPYTEEDLTWADELGRRVAVVIDNARLFQNAQQAVRVRDEFLGIAGHELKTPLTALQLSLQGLARLPGLGGAGGSGSTPDVASRRLGSCLRQVDRLGKLTNELLDVARIKAGRLSLQRESVDLVALTREVIARMADELARAGCLVALQADDVLVGCWDRERIDQLLTNLISNAAKYGKGKPIALVLRRTDGAAELAVRDEGIGVAPEDQTRIFERFERAVSERNYGGLGLGLWIVRQIVEVHGGVVRVESAVGQGSTFTVDLPLSAA